jgi:protein NDRG1
LVNCELFDPIRSKFCICHINIPGLEAAAADVQTGCYPTLDQMAEMIPYIVEKFKLKRMYLFGVGVGSNIFLRYMLNDQSKVEGLIFANPLFSQQPWSGYFWNKVIGMGSSFDILNDYHFNNDYNTENCIDVYQSHQQNFRNFHQANLRELITTVNKRTGINLVRTEMGKSNVRVPSLLLVGDSSPFNDDAAELNSRLNPSITTFAKLQDAGSMILEQQPMKVAEAILLFLKGEGHFTNLSILEISKKRAKAVQQQQDMIDGEKQDPISV